MQQAEPAPCAEIPASERQPAATLDLRGLRCPMPVLRTRKALASLVSGSCLVIECTDPLAAIDIPHLVAQTGDTLLGMQVCEDIQVFSIRKR